MKEWYIARGDKKYGPYALDDMIVLRQQRKIFEYDLVWKSGMRQWKVLIQTEEFSAQSMAERALKAETCDVFNRRQWPRVKKEIPVYIHNNQNLWKAKTLNISQGGTLLELNAPFLKAGDHIHIHFQGEDSKQNQFSCSGTITGKRFSHERLHVNSLIQYNVRFEEMDEGALPQLREWVQFILNEKEKPTLSKGV